VGEISRANRQFEYAMNEAANAGRMAAVTARATAREAIEQELERTNHFSYGSEWVEFERLGASASGRTCVWAVRSKEKRPLGIIKWYAPWRCYAFNPMSEMSVTLEHRCLRDIANFCERATNNHREAVRERKRET